MEINKVKRCYFKMKTHLTPTNEVAMSVLSQFNGLTLYSKEIIILETMITQIKAGNLGR